MTAIEQIGNFFKSIQGILTCVIVAGGIISSALLRHDAKVRMDFVKSNKSVSLHDVDSVSNKNILPVITQLETVISDQGVLANRLKRDSIARIVFQDNYSRLLWDKFGNEWMKYMNGMQITVVQDPTPTIIKKSLEEVKPSYKIRIVPINKNDTLKR
jgi:hypothetical protein